jgi:hypothetical protein
MRDIRPKRLYGVKNKSIHVLALCQPPQVGIISVVKTLSRRWLASASPFQILLGLSVGLNAIVFPRLDVGHFNDDALYILAARSLLRGHYVADYVPGMPPMNDPLPGFPVLLLPFVSVVQGHWAVLKCIPFLLIVGALLLFWKLLHRLRIPRGQALAATAFFAFNPTIVRMSNALMSEPFFLVLVLGVFNLLAEAWIDQRPLHKWLLGLLLGWAAIVRPQGAVLLACVAIGLMNTRTRRDILLSLGLGSFILGSVYFTNFLNTSSIMGYIPQATSVLPVSNADPLLFLRHSTFLFLTLFIKVLIAFPWPPDGHALLMLHIILALGVGLALFRGAAEFSRRYPAAEDLGLCIGGFVSLYLLVHMFWPAIDLRYCVPVLPFVILFIVQGAANIRQKWLRKVLGGLGVLVGLFYGYENVRTINQAFHKTYETAVPKQTFDWIRHQAPPTARIFARYPATTYLYTDRQVPSDVQIQNIDELRYFFVTHNVSHVLITRLQPATMASISHQREAAFWDTLPLGLEGWPRAFRKVYANPDEYTLIFEVASAPLFERAYTLYREGMREVARGHNDNALRIFDQALQIDADLVPALDAAGVTRLLMGRDLLQARKDVKHALVIHPASPRLWTNLAQIYDQLGQSDRASVCRTEARRLAGGLDLK